MDHASSSPGRPKLPAARALALAGHPLAAPESRVPLHAPARAHRTWPEVAHEEDGGVGALAFDIPNGALRTDGCRRLLDALRYARGRDTRVIVLAGGHDVSAPASS